MLWNSVPAMSTTRANLISHKFGKTELGLVNVSDSSGMIHSKTSVKKQEIHFFL